MGDRELNLLLAVAEVGKLPQSKVTALSRFYETEPVGPVTQDNFFNAVLRLTTSLAASDLLAALQSIETSRFKRTRDIAWGPRRMDLDLLLYGDIICTDAALTLPHPRLHERRFVLQPLADIAPNLRHPALQRTITELLTALPATERVTPVKES